MNTARTDRLFWTLLLAGLVLRIVLLVVVRDVGVHTDDERDYTQLAASLASGDGFAFADGRATSIRPPLYPAFVASLWTVSGTGNLLVIRLAQIVLSMISVWFLLLLTREMFDETTARWTAVAWWLYPSFLYAGVLILTEVLFTFWLLAGTLCAVRAVRRSDSPAWWALGAGAAMGLAALTRSVLWPLPIVLAPLLALLAGGRWRRGIAVAALLVAGWLAVVAPWSYRNTRLQQTLVIVDTMGGMNLRMGNYEHTIEKRMWDGVSLHGKKAWSYEMVTEHPEASYWTEGQRERWARDRAIEYIVANPGTTARRAVLKFADFWGLEREYIAALRDKKYQPPLWFALVSSAAILLSYVAAMLLAATGIVNSRWRNPKAHVLALLMVVWICALHTVVFGHSRYHLPVMPLLLAYSVAAVRQSSWRLSGAATWRRRLAFTTAAVLALIWAHEMVRDLDRLNRLLAIGGA